MRELRVRLLGSAAGGGLPQWNCRCRNCQSARQGAIVSRTQSSVAFSPDGDVWYLINASPDIRTQLAALTVDSIVSGRDRGFEAILLSNGDLDHTLGLLIVREGGPVTTFCSTEVWQTLSGALGFDRILGAFHGEDTPGLIRRNLVAGLNSLGAATGRDSGLELRVIMMGGSPPRYDRSGSGGEGSGGVGHACAFVIDDRGTGGRFVCALDVPEFNADLIAEIRSADLSLVDGTFWSENEMVELGFSTRSATEMGHWPISGPNGSLAALASRGTIVYSHINNTNPILDTDSHERALVTARGMVVGEDGMEWIL